MHKKQILIDAYKVSEIRPKADLTIEQYLMTPESMVNQVIKLEHLLKGKKVFFLGDDDHISTLFAKYLKVKPVVAEYDARIRKSLKNIYNEFKISKYEILEYDVRNDLKELKVDLFYINPPYSSKNQGKGAKAWLNRASKTVRVGSTSVLVYPVDEQLPWTLTCTESILEYAKECGLYMSNIHKDLHTYQYLPNDPGLLSSNILLFKLYDTKNEMISGISGEALYR